MSEDTRKDADRQAHAQVEYIQELLAAQTAISDGETAELDGYKVDEEGVMAAICENPLDSSYTRESYEDGEEDEEDPITGFTVLLCTGGPAVRIVGDLYAGVESNVRVESQGWFIPWQRIALSASEQDAVNWYVGALGVVECMPQD